MANEEVIAAVRERLTSLLAGGSSESHPTRDQVLDRPVVQEDGAASVRRSSRHVPQRTGAVRLTLFTAQPRFSAPARSGSAPSRQS